MSLYCTYNSTFIVGGQLICKGYGYFLIFTELCPNDLHTWMTWLLCQITSTLAIVSREHVVVLQRWRRLNIRHGLQHGQKYTSACTHVAGHRCRYLLVSRYHLHTGTPFKHATHSKNVRPYKLRLDHTGLRTVHGQHDHKSLHTQVRINLLLQRPLKQSSIPKPV